MLFVFVVKDLFITKILVHYQILEETDWQAPFNMGFSCMFDNLIGILI